MEARQDFEIKNYNTDGTAFRRIIQSAASILDLNEELHSIIRAFNLRPTRISNDSGKDFLRALATDDFKYLAVSFLPLYDILVIFDNGSLVTLQLNAIILVSDGLVPGTRGLVVSIRLGVPVSLNCLGGSSWVSERHIYLGTDHLATN